MPGIITGGRGWAFVDVETTGLNAALDRVLSLSILTYGPDGSPEGEFHSLFDPGCDPGPVWVHGLTRDRLRGQPAFVTHASTIRELLSDRVMVAHNAQFDYRFLHAETRRASLELPTKHRLCTVALSRRLDLQIPNHRLETVASYWGVRQHAAHDARDDVRVLREIFQHSRQLATTLGVELPVVACAGRGSAVYPERVPRVAPAFKNPASWAPPAPLVQGMKIVITGPTRQSRSVLAQHLAGHGFDVMNSVSGQTRLIVCNEENPTGSKATKARALGVAFMTEDSLMSHLTSIRPGVPRQTRSSRSSTPNRGLPTPPQGAGSSPSAPWSGRTVLVLGGTPEEAARARERLGLLGARVLVNLGARTTHVLVLDGGREDVRMGKVLARGIPVVHADDVVGEIRRPHPKPALNGVVMGRGHVIDLPGDSRTFALAANWGSHLDGVEVDIVAFALREDETVQDDDDFVFYNQPSTPDGGVRLTVDGDCEQGVDVDLEALPEGTTRVRVAAAIDGEANFGAVGAIGLKLIDTTLDEELAATTLDAATTERALVLADLYLRGDVWRFRCIGRGYDDGLRDLAERHGVEVDPV